MIAKIFKLISFKRSSLPLTGSLNSSSPSDEFISVKKSRRIFFICEPLIDGFFLFPFLIFFWQSGWNFMTEWFSSPSGQHPAILPLFYLSSQMILLLIYLNQDFLYTSLTQLQQKSKWLALPILQLHSFFTALSYVVQWTAKWTLLDYYTSDDYVIILFIGIIAILSILVITGQLSDLVCSPFIISYDSVEYNIHIGTLFNTEKVCLYRLSSPI